jgi:hypothetical protein
VDASAPRKTAVHSKAASEVSAYITRREHAQEVIQPEEEKNHDDLSQEIKLPMRVVGVGEKAASTSGQGKETEFQNGR